MNDNNNYYVCVQYMYFADCMHTCIIVKTVCMYIALGAKGQLSSGVLDSFWLPSCSA